MKKLKSLQLLIIGIFIICGVQIIGHYLKMADMLSGIFIGAGFGLMTLTLIRQRLRAD